MRARLHEQSALHDTRCIRVAHRRQAVGHDQHRDRQQPMSASEGVLTQRSDSASSADVASSKHKTAGSLQSARAIALPLLLAAARRAQALADLRLRLLGQLVDEGRRVRRPQALGFSRRKEAFEGRRRRSRRDRPCEEHGLLADHRDAPMEPGVGSCRHGPIIEQHRRATARRSSGAARALLLPEPDGPTSATTSPGAARKLTPRSTSVSGRAG